MILQLLYLVRNYRVSFLFTFLGRFVVLATIAATASATHEHTHREPPILIVVLAAIAAIVLLLLFFLAEVDVQALGEVADEADVEVGEVGRGAGYYYLGVFHIIAIGSLLF